MKDMVPPQATETEMAVLGALMLESNAIDEVAGILTEDSFYKEEHQKIFSALRSLFDKHKPIDLLTVTQELRDHRQLDSIGGAGYIVQLTRNVASSAHIQHHARIIAEMYYRRKTIREANEIIKMAYDYEDVEVIGDRWKRSGDNLEDVFTVSDAGTHIKEVLKNTLAEIEKDCISAQENKTPGIPTGFKALNENTGGWRRGNLIVLASRPGVGKTSLALQFARTASMAGYWVNIFSLEMNKEDLARIMIASESNVYRSKIRDGNLSQFDWDDLHLATTRLINLPILFIDTAGMTINQVKAIIHNNQKYNRCDLAIIDYLQLVKSQQPKAVRELEVSEISRTLKTISLTENIPVMALSQLNRDADSKEPALSHLRESGAIEQDADMVIFLTPNGNSINLKVAKHRRGKTGDINIYHNDQFTAFNESGNFDNSKVSF